jgi:hypothetical protein
MGLLTRWSLKDEASSAKMVIKLEENWGKHYLRHMTAIVREREWVGVYMGNEILTSLVCKVLLDFRPR